MDSVGSALEEPSPSGLFLILSSSILEWLWRGRRAGTTGPISIDPRNDGGFDEARARSRTVWTRIRVHRRRFAKSFSRLQDREDESGILTGSRYPGLRSAAASGQPERPGH